MTLSKAAREAQEAERMESIAMLLGTGDEPPYLVPGDTVYTIVRHVSRSGMRRSISPVIITPTGTPWDITWAVQRIMRWGVHRDHYGIIVDGCGMDMAFHLVYSLSRALFPDGHACAGPRYVDEERQTRFCGSNDHSNGMREYGPDVWHKDGGYALHKSSL
jgi:hypothetical protein